MARVDKIGTHKTTIITDTANITRIRYHSTDVVSFDHGTIALQTGGHYTATTKMRMNQTAAVYSLGFKVYQKNFDFFVDYKGKTFSLGRRLVLPRMMHDGPCNGYNAICDCIICEDYRAKVKRSMVS